jgi:glutaredoxin
MVMRNASWALLLGFVAAGTLFFLACGEAAVEAAAQPQAQRVVVYTTSWCGWCRKTLAWLDGEGIPYENRDIEKDPAYREELIRKSGGTSIPVVEIDGRIIRGFDTRRMAQALRSS